MSFNADQLDYMASLAATAPEKLCWCGWYPIGTCPHCPAGLTAADKIAERCPHCRNTPSPPPDGPITHVRKCPRGGAA